jgi:pyruvate dehydrogenase E1 component alpha subunit
MHAAMDANDAFTSAYRVHGWAHLLGSTVQEVIGELVGAHCGMSMGKGGSMHMYGDNFYGGNGIVGAQVRPLVHHFPAPSGVVFGRSLETN